MLRAFGFQHLQDFDIQPKKFPKAHAWKIYWRQPM